MTDNEMREAEYLKQRMADKYFEAREGKTVMVVLNMEQANILFRAVSFYIDHWKKIRGEG